MKDDWRAWDDDMTPKLPASRLDAPAAKLSAGANECHPVCEPQPERASTAATAGASGSNPEPEPFSPAVSAPEGGRPPRRTPFLTNAHLPLSPAELDELQRRLSFVDDPNPEHTRAAALQALIQLRKLSPASPSRAALLALRDKLVKRRADSLDVMNRSQGERRVQHGAEFGTLSVVIADIEELLASELSQP